MTPDALIVSEQEVWAKATLMDEERFGRIYQVAVGDGTHVWTHDVLVSSRDKANDELALRRALRKFMDEFQAWRAREDRVSEIKTDDEAGVGLDA